MPKSCKNINRYIYKVTDKNTGEFYVGSRTCKCPIDKDKYMGSSKYWEDNPPKKDNLFKEVIEYGFKSEEDKFVKESEIINEVFDDPDNVNLHNPSKKFFSEKSCPGEKNGMYGVLGEKHPCAVPIYQFSKTGKLINTWNYIKEAEEILGFNRIGIIKCLKGRSFTSNGYVWRYKDDVTSIKEEGERIKNTFNEYKHGLVGRTYTDSTINKMSESKKGMYDGKENPFYGKAHSIETINKISEKLSGENHPNYGKKRPDHANKLKNYFNGGITAKKVVHVATGKVYKSLCAASKETGLSAGTICGHCKGKYITQKFKYYV